MWKVSINEMSFINSLKMKVAVILGVVHMMFGLFLRLYNNIRQKKWTDILLLTIPQLVFMCCTFVYMDYIIIYKWSQNYEDTSKAPSVISTMIAVFVNMAKYDPKDLLFWPG
jgi:V-type H+-transporting ATPase subunit a